MKSVWSIVDGEIVGFSIERINLSMLDSVGYTPNGFAKIGSIELLVKFLRGKSLDDIGAVDVERLDDGT